MRVELTQGYHAEVDFSDWWKVQGHNWCVLIHGTNVYAVRAIGNTTLYMHHIILPPKPGYHTDHKDGNGLNNRYANLRYATRRQNNINRVHANASGYRGVAETAEGTWRAQIRIEGRRLHLGTFDTAEEAAVAYDNAAKEHHGEFAVLNFEED